MTNQKALIRAERVGDHMEVEFRGKFEDIARLYRCITANLFHGFCNAAKGDNNKEIAANGVSAMIQTLLSGVAITFEQTDVDQELKPFVKGAIKDVIRGFDEDIDTYFFDDDELLDSLSAKAERISSNGDAKELIDILDTLAKVIAAHGVKKENTK